ncbi:MAG: hypothetical protein ACREHD_16035, partial [Pirellulales bacterium]
STRRFSRKSPSSSDSSSPMVRPHFTLSTLLVAMLVVAAFFGGIHFERERRRREDDAIARQMEGLPLLSLPSQEDWDRMTKRRKVR